MSAFFALSFWEVNPRIISKFEPQNKSAFHVSVSFYYVINVDWKPYLNSDDISKYNCASTFIIHTAKIGEECSQQYVEEHLQKYIEDII